MIRHPNIRELYRRTRAIAAEMDIKIKPPVSAPTPADALVRATLDYAPRMTPVLDDTPFVFIDATVDHRDVKLNIGTTAVLTKGRQPKSSPYALQFLIDKEFKLV